MSAAVKPKDRERMADHLQALGLYATANDVRARRAKLSDGVAHVRDYCLPNMRRALTDRLKKDKAVPPKPGTWGAWAAQGICERRDELQAFLDDWSAYDFSSRNPQGEEVDRG